MHRQALYHGLKKLEKQMILEPQDVEEILALMSCARRVLPLHEPDYSQKLTALNNLIDHLGRFDQGKTPALLEKESRDIRQLFFIETPSTYRNAYQMR